MIWSTASRMAWAASLMAAPRAVGGADGWRERYFVALSRVFPSSSVLRSADVEGLAADVPLAV